jgi:2-hydroxychromene-2-carboxylate isomerase
LRAKLDLDELENELTQRSNELESKLEENDRLLRAAGHWGVPTMVVEREPFFGQDRFDLVVWRLKQIGVNEV